MDIILDPSFFHALLQTADIESDNYRDFEHFIKHLKNINLVVKCSSVEDFYRMVKEDPYLESLINSSPLKIQDSDSLLEDIKLQEFYEGGSCFKLFLLSESAESCAALSEAFGYEYISPENFEQLWTTFNSSRGDIIRKVTEKTSLQAEYRFDSWNCLDSFVHPVNSVLINDSYILNDQPGKRIRDNLLPLLKKLTQRVSSSNPVEITILADQNQNQLDYKKMHARLTEELDRQLGKDKYTLNLVKHSVHDRFILTNYYYIKSGRGFTIFKENGQLNSQSDTTFEFHFIYTARERAIIFYILKEIKDKLLKIERSSPDAAYEVIFFYPGKENKLLNEN